MIPHVRNALEHGLKGGLHVRFLLLKPNSEAVRMAAFRDSFEDEKRINLALQATISDLSILASKKLFLQPNSKFESSTTCRRGQ